MNTSKVEIIMGDGSPTPESVTNAVLGRIADAQPVKAATLIASAPALHAERDALRNVARELVTRWDDVQRGLRDPSCLCYANELALAALAKGVQS